MEILIAAIIVLGAVYMLYKHIKKSSSGDCPSCCSNCAYYKKCPSNFKRTGGKK
ncbi:MAG: FeoB-associated Cys-rich membrane protein [Clostridiales bacterium]|nr:FeoB-associated Cys-rich membrane protein [Clostridiales bacterium]